MPSKRAANALRDELLELQSQLRGARFALALIVTGAPAAGRSETINELLEWLDPKYIRVHAFGRPDAAERRRPSLWRYWQSLPPQGRMAFYFAGWYSDLILGARESKRIAPARAKRAIARIRQLEAMLVADGIEVVKVHLHVDKKTQTQRLQRLSADKLTRWRVTAEDRWFAKHHDRAKRIAQHYLKATRQSQAPWHIIDGENETKRLLKVGTLLRDALRAALIRHASALESKALAQESVARAARLTAKPKPRPLESDVYKRELESLQGRLALLVRRARFRKHGLVLAFEGIDAAGKGGTIRRITHALDARQYQVVPISAPSSEEAAYPYLWRFWRHVPECGEIAIFDRSWYGRVLVERVRSLTPRPDWQRAYDEINEFECQLTEFGIVVAKFWLSVSKDEQLERFKAREENPLKRFKVDKEDWVNRDRYEEYQLAAAEMIERTSREDARWTVVDADDKKHARLAVLKAVCEEVERRIA